MMMDTQPRVSCRVCLHAGLPARRFDRRNSRQRELVLRRLRERTTAGRWRGLAGPHRMRPRNQPPAVRVHVLALSRDGGATGSLEISRVAQRVTWQHGRGDRR